MAVRCLLSSEPPAEPLLQPLGRVRIHSRVGRTDLAECEVVCPSGYHPIEAPYDLLCWPALVPWVRLRADPAAYALNARDAQHSEPHWGYSFLPGDNPPERELRNALDAHPEIAAGALGRTVEELHAAAAALAGEDDHDWLTGLAERSGKSDEQLVDGLADAWLAAEANYDAAVALAGNVRALL